MDPKTNLREQLQLARTIQHQWDHNKMPDIDDCARLCELVIALDEWRRKGGFDPYGTEQVSTR